MEQIIKKDQKNKALLSFILGLVGLLIWLPGLADKFTIFRDLRPFISLVISICGLFLGIKGISSSKKYYKILSIIGIVLCILPIILLLLAILGIIFLASMWNS